MAKKKPVAAAPELNREIATVADGVDITRGYVGPLLVNTDSVLRARGQGNLALYESVYSDPQVKSVWAQRQLAVTQCDWRVEPASDEPVDVRAADSLRDELNRIGWDRVTTQMMFGVFYGYAVSELIYGRADGRVCIDRVKVRNRRRFRFDPEGGLRLLTPSDMLEGVPADSPYFWHFATGADNDDEPYGLGLAHWLYWPVFFKRQGVRFWLRFLDKFGQPSRLGKYDSKTATPADKSRLLAAAAAMGTDSAVIIPEGMTLELIEAARSGAADYQQLHDTMDATMARVVLGQTASSQGTPGRLGNDELQGDVRKDLIKADADLICESWNLGPARWLTAWNHPDAQPPRVFRDVEEPEDLKVRAERDEVIARTTGFRPTLSYVNQTYGGEWESRPQAVTPNLEPDPAAAAGGDAVKFAAPTQRADPTLAPLIATQAALDSAVEALPGGALDQAVEPMLRPVVDAIQRGASAEHAAELLLQAVPDMDDTELAERLARAMFVAQLWGQIGEQDPSNGS